MTVNAICNHEVIFVSKDTSMQEAALQMKLHNVGSVVVVNNIKNDLSPCGILTDRDIAVKVVADDVEPDQLTVVDAMTKDLLVIKQDENINDVIGKMASKGVRRAPVVNKKNKLCGVIAIDDLVVLLSNELQRMARLIQKQAIKIS